MKVNPAHLQTFAVVAETGSLTRAGLLLDLGQSAISSQLRQLQAQMGEPLYRRSGHGVTLTPAGERLLPYAREVARQVRLAQGLAAELQRPRSEVQLVRLGLCLTLGETLPPLILRACATRCPEIQLEVLVAPTMQLGRAIEQGELSLAFAGAVPQPSPSAPHALQVRHVATDQLVWVSPPGAAPVSTLGEAAALPWLWAHAQSSVKQTVESAAAQLGVRLPPGQVLGSYSAVWQGVMAGLGGAFFPRHSLGYQPAADLLAADPLAADALATNPLAAKLLRGVVLAGVELRLPYQLIGTTEPPSEAVQRVRQIALQVLDETLQQAQSLGGRISPRT